MRTLVFSSDRIPAQLHDITPVSVWRDLCPPRPGGTGAKRNTERPGEAPLEIAFVSRLVLLRSQIARSCGSNEGWTGEAPCFVASHRRGSASALSGQNALAICIETTPDRGYSGTQTRWVGFAGPRDVIHNHMGQDDDLVLVHSGGENPAVDYLKRYLNFLLDAGELDASLDKHIEETLLDLAAMTLTGEASGNGCHVRRGLRAARLRDVLGYIETNFSDPAITVRTSAAKLGISPRYVNDLLHETGASFSRRVLELRLRKARGMLDRCANDGLRISEIAYACGFNEVSYFNRCFRHRFGAAPTTYRSLH